MDLALWFLQSFRWLGTCPWFSAKMLAYFAKVQLFDGQEFNDKRVRWVYSSKTKKTFLIVIPAGAEGASLCESRNLLHR